jgi:hypothetical protein
MFNGWQNFVGVSNGGMRGIRGYYDRIDNGRVTITDNTNGVKRKTIINVRHSLITTKRIMEKGQTVHYVEYGKVSKRKGRYILKFRKGTHCGGYDGLSTRYDQEVFGYKGVCKTFYVHGRMMWQKFYFEGTKKLCYHFNPYKKGLVMRHPNGNPLYEFAGEIDSRRKVGGYLVWKNHWGDDRENMDWSKDGNCSFKRTDINGRIVSQGEYSNKQRVGEWVINKQPVYFMDGLTVPKKMYDTPPEKIDPIKVLRLKDVDVRSIMLNRIGLKLLAEKVPHEVIHNDKKGGMRLLKFNGKVDPPINILQVTCPSTKQHYFLRVPPDILKCEEARQWTFHVEPGEQPINFDVET